MAGAAELANDDPVDLMHMEQRSTRMTGVGAGGRLGWVAGVVSMGPDAPASA